MFCSNCGKQLDDNAKYCTHCGAKVIHIGENASSFQSQQSVFKRDENSSYNRLPQDVHNRQHSEHVRPAFQDYNQPYVQLTVQNKKRTNGKRTVAIVLAGLLIFFCTVFIVFFFRHNQNSYQHYMDLGNRYLSELKYSEAVNAFTKAIDIEPKRSQAYEGRADAYSYMQEYDLAIVDYERAIELAPDHGEEIQLKLDDLRASSGPESAVESEVNADSSENTAAPEERNDNIAAAEEKNAGSTIPVLKLEEIYKQNDAGDCDMRYERLSLGDGTDVLYPELNAALVSFSDECASEIEKEYQDLAATVANYSEDDLMVYQSFALGRSDENVVSVNIGFFDYGGGAHGYYKNTGATFDVKSGTRLSLGDICNDMVELTNIVTNALYDSDPSIYESGRDALRQTIQDGFMTPSNNDSWVLMPEGVLFYFPPYSVSYFAAGQPNALIKFSEHPELFNPTYCETQSEYVVYLPSESSHWILDDYNNDGSVEEIEMLYSSDGSDWTTYTSFRIYINHDEIYVENTPGFEKSRFYLCKSGGKTLMMIDLAFVDGTDTTYVFDISNGTAEKIDEENGGIFARTNTSENGNPCFMLSSKPDRLLFGEDVKTVADSGVIEAG